jgi:hypothetical protein
MFPKPYKSPPTYIHTKTKNGGFLKRMKPKFFVADEEFDTIFSKSL